jgi:hypothetical protein
MKDGLGETETRYVAISSKAGTKTVREEAWKSSSKVVASRKVIDRRVIE